MVTHFSTAQVVIRSALTSLAGCVCLGVFVALLRSKVSFEHLARSMTKTSFLVKVPIEDARRNLRVGCYVGCVFGALLIVLGVVIVVVHLM